MAATKKARGPMKKGSTKSSTSDESSKDRCWNGYEPVPGKKPFTKGSCRKKDSK